VTTINQPERFTAERSREPNRARQPGIAQRPGGGKSAAPEKRCATRRPAALIPSITGVRIPPHGSGASLLNISTSGVLLECTGRIPLGTAVTVFFDGTFSPSSASGRVARSAVASMSKKGVLLYHIGIAFNDPIALEDEAAPPVEDVAEPEPADPQQLAASLPEDTPTPVVVTTPVVNWNRW